MSATETFQTFQRDITNIVSSVYTTVNNNLPKQTGEQKKVTVRGCERQIDDAKELLIQMEKELKNQPLATRSTLTTLFQSLTKQIDALTSALTRAGKERGGYSGSYGTIDNSYLPYTDEDSRLDIDPQRQRLLATQERLNRTNDTLTASETLATNTETLGTGILGDLLSQREVIGRASNQLHETDATLSRSKKILNAMKRQSLVTKAITCITLVVVLAIIGLIIYLTVA